MTTEIAPYLPLPMYSQPGELGQKAMPREAGDEPVPKLIFDTMPFDPSGQAQEENTLGGVTIVPPPKPTYPPFPE